jgi:hypothetical protein
MELEPKTARDVPVYSPSNPLMDFNLQADVTHLLIYIGCWHSEALFVQN